MLVMLKLKEMSESDMLNVEDTGLIGKDQKNCIHVLSGRALGGVDEGWRVREEPLLGDVSLCKFHLQSLC